MIESIPGGAKSMNIYSPELLVRARYILGLKLIRTLAAAEFTITLCKSMDF